MSDLDKLQRDLGTVPRYSQRFVHAALKVTAFEAKESWRRHVEGPPHYTPTVDYEVSGDFPKYEAEIGPNLERYGGRTGKGGLAPSLGILEDANGGVTAAPQKARPKVLRDIEPDFERGLDRAVDDALRRAGL